MKRLHTLLLRLYSPEFRRDFGEDALRVLDDDMTEARAAGGLRSLLGPTWLSLEFALHGLGDRGARLRARLSVPTGSYADGWAQDARLAFRASMRRPGFVIVAVTSLAIGVGATSVVFTVADTLMMREIPGVGDPDRIVELELRSPRGGSMSWPFLDFRDVEEKSGLLERVAAYNMDVLSVSDEGRGERLLALYVSSGYFETLGVTMSRGRAFVPEEDHGPGQHPVVVLSHSEWLSRFDGDADVLGRTLRLNRETYTVVGVAAPDFRGNTFGAQPSVYLPLTQVERLRKQPEVYRDHRGSHWLEVIGRMKPDVEVDAVTSELGSIFAGLAEEYPESNAGRTANAVPAGPMPAVARTGLSLFFGFLAMLMLLVLATACANVGGMLLARASAQERDMAVRLALGSGRGRLVRLLFFESVVIFGLGGAAGLWLAWQGVRNFDPNRFLPTPFPIHLDFILDWRVVTFGLGLSIFTGLLFGLLPALQVTGGNLISALREQAAGYGVRAGRMRKLFVAGQVTVSILMLAIGGFFVGTVQRSAQIDPGFDPDGVWVTRFDLALEGYRDTEQAEPLLDRMLEHLRAQPYVESATISSSVPLDGRSSSTTVFTDGLRAEGANYVQSSIMGVTDGFFETLGIDMVDGRPFTVDDGRLTPRVAVINERLAEMAWPGESAVGRVVDFGIDSAGYTVIGVAKDTQSDRATHRIGPQIFSLLVQDYRPSVVAVVRTPGTSYDVVGPMRSDILLVDPALAMDITRSLGDLARLGLLPYRIAAGLAAALGLLALFLSAIGIYGIVAFMVTQRTREIGVRIALGASRKQVLGRVVRGGIALALPGFVIGTALAIGVGQLLRSVIAELHPLDPLALGSVTVLLIVVVALASLVPARRASSIAPMDALRQE